MPSGHDENGSGSRSAWGCHNLGLSVNATLRPRPLIVTPAADGYKGLLATSFIEYGLKCLEIGSHGLKFGGLYERTELSGNDVKLDLP